MKQTNWQIVILTLTLLATFFAFSCSDNNAGQTDGDDSNPITCSSNAPSCNSNSDCILSCMVCDLSGEEGCCGTLSCTDNLDCDQLGAGSYCNNGTCFCASDGDEDNTKPDGDEFEYDQSLTIEPASIDFGSVQYSGMVCKTVKFENTGEGVIKLNGLILIQDNASLDEMEIEYTDEGNIPSDENVITLYEKDTTSIEFCYSPNNPGMDTGEIVIGTTIGMERIPWSSTQKGSPHITSSCEGLTEDQKESIKSIYGDEWADACSFGTVAVSESKTISITITNEQLDPAENAVLIINDFEEINPATQGAIDRNIEIVQSTLDYVDNTTSIWLSKEGNSKSTTFDIEYIPTDDSVNSDNKGIDRLEILVYHNDPATNGGDENKPYIIRAIGFGIMPVLQTTPESTMNFNSVQKGQCSTKIQELKNIGYDDLEIYDAYLISSSAVANGVFTIDTNPVLDPNIYSDIPEDSIDNVKNVTLAPFERTAVALTCCPLGSEAYTAQLEIRSNDQAKPDSIKTIYMNCTGQQAYCDVYPKKEINFGAVRVGKKVSQTVVINNNGLATAVIESVVFDASGDTDFSHSVEVSSLPLNIPPGGSAEIDVYYQPESARSHSSKLKILPKEGDCEETTIDLYGTGIEPALEGPENCLTWENAQVVNDTITGDDRLELLDVKSITLLSSGSDTLKINQVFISDKNSGSERPSYTITNIPSLPAQIPQGIEWGFNVAYDPPQLGEYSGYVVICSDAANANGAPISCPASEGNCCSDSSKTPHEICLTGTALDPHMCVSPELGKVIFTNVIVGDPPPPEQIIEINNCGEGDNGNITIEDIRYAWGGSNSIKMSRIEYNGTDYIGNYPSDGIVLEPGESIFVNVGCEPEYNGPQGRIIEIVHDDIDMTKPGNFLGSEAPIYRLEVYCYTENNTPPIAIVKSPANKPEGKFGTWERTLVLLPEGITERITIDGSESYDLDSATTTDTIINYEWNIDPDLTVLSAETEGPNVTSIDVQATTTGEFNVGLKVEDTHGGFSEENHRDANITIKVKEKPYAIAGRCSDFSTYFEAETGENICFTAEHSKDNDGTIVSYDWEVEKYGGEKFNFSTSSTAHFTFTEIGTYLIYLTVTDNDGYTDELDTPIRVDTFADESLKIELTWSGSGDVDLHYVKPFGTFEDANSDCNAGTCLGTMDWGEHGNPKFVQSSTSGSTPEVITHDDAGDGTYTVYAKYITAPEECITYDDCKMMESCAQCGCNCLPWCLLGNFCCITCNVCEERTDCGPVPAFLTFKLYYGSSTVPDTVSGTMWKLTDEDTYLSFVLKRQDGKWSRN